ncbi:MAG TPA: hypothetical protein VGM51_12000 [Armatimonadota bacterium]
MEVSGTTANVGDIAPRRSDLERRFKILWDDFAGGWLCLCTWQAIVEAIGDDRLPGNTWFLQSILKGCRCEAIMALSRILDPVHQRFDHASLPRFLAEAENQPDGFIHAPTRDELLGAVEASERWIREHYLVKRLRTLRNKFFAHSALYGPGRGAPPVSVRVTEAEALYIEISEVVNIFEGYFEECEWSSFDLAKQDILREFEWMLGSALDAHAAGKVKRGASEPLSP